MSTEVWKPVLGVTGCQVSSLGRIRNKAGLIMRQHIQHGYATVMLGSRIDGSRKRRGVHRMVCEAFHGAAPSDQHQAVHNDGDPAHNTPENLRWATRSENAQDSVTHGTRPMGCGAAPRLSHAEWEARRAEWNAEEEVIRQEAIAWRLHLRDCDLDFRLGKYLEAIEKHGTLADMLLIQAFIGALQVSPRSDSGKLYLRTMLPYKFHAQFGNLTLPLNREYKPIGVAGSSLTLFIPYEPFLMTHGLKNLGLKESEWMYSDENPAWDSRKECKRCITRTLNWLDDHGWPRFS